MNIIVTDNAVFGPYKSIEVMPDHLMCDDSKLPLSVIGDYEISDNLSLLPGPSAEEIAAATAALKEAGEQAITQRIQAVVDNYNRENGTAFDNVHNCESYSRVDEYTHQAFCLAVWTWNVAVWEAARTALIQSMAGEITITCVDDILDLLPEFTE